MSVGSAPLSTAEAMEAYAMPCRRGAVHADPTTPPSAEQLPLPDAVARTPLAEKSPAQWAYERLILYIKRFEEQLDPAQEIAMGFAGNDAGVLRIEGLGYFDPDIITFYGRDDSGTRTQLIQHVGQLSVVLKVVPVETPKPPRRIGFRLAEELDSASAVESGAATAEGAATATEHDPGGQG